jgi:four helix bundle protein
MTIKKFEDLKVWKHAFSLTQNVYELTQQNGFERDYALKDQIRRASISVMNNISEGIDRSGNKEFIQFLAIAKGSAAEIRSMLYIAESQGYISENQNPELTTRNSKPATQINGRSGSRLVASPGLPDQGAGIPARSLTRTRTWI